MNSKKRILGILLGVMVLAAGIWYWHGLGKVETDDAQVDGRIFMVSPRVAGYVVDVPVQDNQFVKEGEVLARLDPTEYEVAVAEARAQLAALQRGVPLELSQTVHRVTGAQAVEEATKRRAAQARDEEDAARYEMERMSTEQAQAALDRRRLEALVGQGAVSREAADRARSTDDAAKARLESSRAKLEAASKARAAAEAEMRRVRAEVDLAGTGQVVAEIRARQVEAQQAKVRQAELNLEWTTVRAPVDGYVTKKNVEPGRMVTRGQPIMAVVPMSPDHLWVTANFKETELTDVKPGQPCEIRVDTYPNLVLKGQVESIMAGTGAAFSLFPPQNASGNFVKVVQRIPVRLRLTDYDPATMPPLRVGMSVVPVIFTGRGVSEVPPRAVGPDGAAVRGEGAGASAGQAAKPAANGTGSAAGVATGMANATAPAPSAPRQ
ncbi:HlyD family secretion protein [Nitratidesulfovibrio sp. SRB-5]|uniref:HlyD family secretion protein n=1 Tax=Nitratidesulfovibrio sp. SRB-5 TaxID=2872636 RepID=UPI001026511C|nr:HlyD family secretion protein [Nitratidesulfovibrio sp. SRB-5]MBZ2172699.1 HlyD family secretion protein [Nitratidesulfovibrio sp. SRB-5]RXF77265.1 HlyD family secretion protein [Desulfovibrio sp. DS-1]